MSQIMRPPPLSVRERVLSGSGAAGRLSGISMSLWLGCRIIEMGCILPLVSRRRQHCFHAPCMAVITSSAPPVAVLSDPVTTLLCILCSSHHMQQPSQPSLSSLHHSSAHASAGDRDTWDTAKRGIIARWRGKDGVDAPWSLASEPTR
jgi:hypothetical protein